MKRILLLALLFAVTILPQSLFAQYVMPFEARVIPAFMPKNYVITNLYDNYFFEVVKEKSDREPFLWDIIAQVNGKNVTSKDNLLELFQEKEEVDLLLIRKVDGQYMGWNCTIRPKNNTNGYGDLLKNIEYSVSQRKKNGLEKCPEGIRVMAKPDLSFYNYNTYDILITGNDPLVDEKILNKFCSSGLFGMMKRDEENPDVIVCVAKSSNESISSTYVPPTTSVVNTGSTTRPVYNYITRTVSFETKQHNRYEHTEGYTQTTTATNIHLEFTVLDAKKMNDPNQKTAPIIWQMSYNRNVTDRNFEIIDEYLAIATWNCFPFTQVNTTEEYSFVMVGAELSWGASSDIYTRIASEVVPGSSADKIGFRKGDRIIRVDGKKKYTVVETTQWWGTWAFMRYKNGQEREKTKEECGSDIAYCARDHIYMIEYCRLDHAYHRAKGYTMYKHYDSPLYRTAEYTVLRDGNPITLNGRLLGPYQGLSKPKLCTRIATIIQ